MTWVDNGRGVGGATGDNRSTAIKAQLFAANGGKIGGEFLVNTEIEDVPANPRTVALAGGGFVVTWTDDSPTEGRLGGDNSGTAIKAQVYTADGTRIGTEFIVNTATNRSQLSSDIIALPNGGFVVTWEDYSLGVGGDGGDSGGSAIKAQVFTASGARVGTELLVNTAVAGSVFSHRGRLAEQRVRRDLGRRQSRCRWGARRCQRHRRQVAGIFCQSALLPGDGAGAAEPERHDQGRRCRRGRRDDHHHIRGQLRRADGNRRHQRRDRRGQRHRRRHDHRHDGAGAGVARHQFDEHANLRRQRRRAAEHDVERHGQRRRQYRLGRRAEHRRHTDNHHRRRGRGQRGGGVRVRLRRAPFSRRDRRAGAADARRR